MKTIVVSGGQSNIGKTSLVLALCELLPGAVAIKLGHGTQKVDKPEVFYPAGTDFSEVAANHSKAAWLVIESNRILDQIAADLAVYLPSAAPKPSAHLAADKADLTRGVPADQTKINNLVQRLDLDTETIRRICWLCGARPSSASFTFVSYRGDESNESAGAQTMAPAPLSHMITPWFDTCRSAVSDQPIFLPSDLAAGGDGRPGPGPLQGLSSALSTTSSEINFILAGDIPAVDLPLIHRLLSLSEGCDIVVPSFQGRWEPLFGVYRKSVYEMAGALSETLQGRLSDIFPLCNTLIVPVDDDCATGK